MKKSQNQDSRKFNVQENVNKPKILTLTEGQSEKCSRCTRARQVALYKFFSSTQPNKCSMSFTKKVVAIVVVGFR
jgi:hypothetical protein